MWKEFNIGTILLYIVDSTNIFFCAENMEEADSKEALEFDGDAYPILPDNVLELQLHRRKGILRQFMGATRRMCHQ